MADDPAHRYGPRSWCFVENISRTKTLTIEGFSIRQVAGHDYPLPPALVIDISSGRSERLDLNACNVACIGAFERNREPPVPKIGIRAFYSEGVALEISKRSVRLCSHLYIGRRHGDAPYLRRWERMND